MCQTISGDKAHQHPQLIYKAATFSGQMFALPLRDDPQLLAIQTVLRETLPADTDWLEPRDFHVTLLYLPEGGGEACELSVTVPPFILRSTTLDTFDTPDGYAVILRLEPERYLKFLQQHLYFRAQMHNLKTGTYSAPDVYTPHITLAYVPKTNPAPVLDLEFLYVQPVYAFALYGKSGRILCRYPLTAEALPSLKAAELTSKGEAVYEIMRAGQAERESAGRALLGQLVRVYKREFNDLIQKAGGSARLMVVDDHAFGRLADIANTDAERIVNTYNRDLRYAIQSIFRENPNFTRAEVMTRLNAWNIGREQWKAPQIALNTELVSTERARQDFFAEFADLKVGARMIAQPRKAVCDICNARINLGEVDADTAAANPFPAHVNCVHSWEVIKFGEGAAPQVSWWRNLINRLSRFVR